MEIRESDKKIIDILLKCAQKSKSKDVSELIIDNIVCLDLLKKN